MKIRRLAIALVLACGLTACAASSRPKQPAHPVLQKAAAASAQEALTIESILRWSLEGKTGTDKILEALHRSFEMKELQDAQYVGDGPVRLADGHTLTFAYTLERSPSIQIGIDPTSCVDPGWAAKQIDASLSPVYQDAHSVDRGRTYYTARNGTFVRLNTTPVTYRCVEAIRISPAPDERLRTSP